MTFGGEMRIDKPTVQVEAQKITSTLPEGKRYDHMDLEAFFRWFAQPNSGPLY